MTITTFFSGGAIDRAGHVRDNDELLRDAWRASASRVIAIWDSRCLIENDAPVLLRTQELGAQAELDNCIYLGVLNDAHIFAHALSDQPEGSKFDETAFASFRGLLSNLTEHDAALLAYAKGMVEWQIRHLYCGRCGAINTAETGGFVMACSSSACEHRNFPRIDPAIIVLVADNKQCLLGQQATWPKGRFSTIAGFVEPGESLEDAVIREVKEETNIDATNVRYLGSQPWPFPTAMMVGFHAKPTSYDIKLNDEELAAAGWFTREEITSGNISLPPTTSIAFRLIEAWFDKWDGPALQTLKLSGDFSRRTGERT
jgi:NAD+ diphosphatase